MVRLTAPWTVDQNMRTGRAEIELMRCTVTPKHSAVFEMECVSAESAPGLLTSSLANLDGTFSAPLFVHGNTGWDALLHRIDMADDANLTAL